MPSSVIRRFDYDGSRRRLDVEFVSGRLYRYHDVPSEVAEEMRAASSKGSYFNRRIRDRYRFTRLVHHPAWAPATFGYNCSLDPRVASCLELNCVRQWTGDSGE